MHHARVAAAKSFQSCPTLYDPTDCSPPGSPVLRILQARSLEWVAISFSKAWKWSRSVMSDSSRPHGLQPTRLLRPWDFPGKSTRVGCHSLGVAWSYYFSNFNIFTKTQVLPSFWFTAINILTFLLYLVPTHCEVDAILSSQVPDFKQ